MSGFLEICEGIKTVYEYQHVTENINDLQSVYMNGLAKTNEMRDDHGEDKLRRTTCFCMAREGGKGKKVNGAKT